MTPAELNRIVLDTIDAHEENRRRMLFAMIDLLSPWHIRMARRIRAWWRRHVHA